MSINSLWTANHTWFCMTFLLSSFFLPVFMLCSLLLLLPVAPTFCCFCVSICPTPEHYYHAWKKWNMNIIEDRKRKFKGFRRNGTKMGRNGKTLRENRKRTKLRLPVLVLFFVFCSLDEGAIVCWWVTWTVMKEILLSKIFSWILCVQFWKSKKPQSIHSMNSIDYSIF